jgi:hypothetical protein
VWSDAFLDCLYLRERPQEARFEPYPMLPQSGPTLHGKQRHGDGQKNTEGHLVHGLASQWAEEGAYVLNQRLWLF